jgi:hypothetical protein
MRDSVGVKYGSQKKMFFIFLIAAPLFLYAGI